MKARPARARSARDGSGTCSRVRAFRMGWYGLLEKLIVAVVDVAVKVSMIAVFCRTAGVNAVAMGVPLRATSN